LRLIDVQGLLQPRRRDLIGPRKDQGNRESESEHQQDKFVRPLGRPQPEKRSADNPQKQQTGEGIQQRNFKNVAAPEF